MKKKILNIVKSWKTTVSGSIVGLLVALQPILTGDGFDIKRDWLKLAVGAGIVLFGSQAKDHDVSGNPPKQIDTP